MDPQNIAKVLGRRGGLARAKRLSSGQRRKIASLGGHARRESMLAAKRIEANFRYVNTIRKLRGETLKVKRLKHFKGPLPGLYD